MFGIVSDHLVFRLFGFLAVRAPKPRVLKEPLLGRNRYDGVAVGKAIEGTGVPVPCRASQG